MYHSSFGLDEQAFSIAVNPRYLYMSAQHKEALAHLLYGVSSGGFVMLSGEVGTGKTTIIRCLLEQLPSVADVAVVMNPSANERDLLCSICDEFGVDYTPNEASLKILTDKLTEFLVRNHKHERQSIVLIDEAQLLCVSTLEQVRLLTNLETNTQKLLQIILVGQPELNELLAKQELRQLSQRITARYHLRALSEGETSAYIKHRLHVAGLPAGRNPFPPNIISNIHSVSRGIPRLVNVLCDRMLLGAYSRGLTVVDSDICNRAVQEVLGEGMLEKPSSTARHPMLYVALGALGALGVVAVGVFVWLFMGLFMGLEGQRLLTPVLEPVAEASSSERVIQDQSTSVSSSLSSSAHLPLSSEASVEMETTKTISGGEYWVRSQDRGVEALLDSLGVSYKGGPYPCWVIAKKGFHCETQQAQNWQVFLGFNRAAVLTITTPSNGVAYVTLLGIKGQGAWLKVGRSLQRVPLSELELMWTGEFVFVWRRPEHYKDAVGLGGSGKMVTWLSQQFAALDRQSSPITDVDFTEALKRRVVIFQKKHKLESDGMVGLQTLLKLNEALGVDKSLTDFESILTGVE